MINHFYFLFIFLVLSDVDSTRMDPSPNSSQPTTSTSPPNLRIKPIWQVPPPNTKMTPLESFRLTKQLVQQRVKDNVIMVTFGNYAFMDFILSWVKHLTDLGLSNLLVGT